MRWTCLACSTANSAVASRCLVCGAGRPDLILGVDGLGHGPGSPTPPHGQPGRGSGRVRQVLLGGLVAVVVLVGIAGFVSVGDDATEVASDAPPASTSTTIVIKATRGIDIRWHYPSGALAEFDKASRKVGDAGFASGAMVAAEPTRATVVFHRDGLADVAGEVAGLIGLPDAEVLPLPASPGFAVAETDGLVVVLGEDWLALQ